ncbi:hypothetical protein HOE425_331437 [Hoeflea sp. EC-HK425]|nr:hypothetical protein HOE425_331437 [Hoeflea sp. EC-HK425]
MVHAKNARLTLIYPSPISTQRWHLWKGLAQSLMRCWAFGLDRSNTSNKKRPRRPDRFRILN